MRPATPQILLLLVACLTATPSLAQAALPDIGHPAGQVISPAAERRIGQALLQELRRKRLVLEDPPALAYLRGLGAELVAAAGEPASAFTFFLVRDRSINAFAAPGGYIGVHIGLILAAERESELAGVLAHEMAHVTQRHLARTFDEARRMNLPTAVALLAAALLGARSPQAGEAALAAGMAGLVQHQVNFTRANEREADRVGIEILLQAGISPEGLVRFFGRLQRERSLYGAEPPEFLSTHPVTPSRIADARARIPPGTKGRQDRLAYQLVRARVEVLTAEDAAAVESRFRKAVATGTHAVRAAARYGLALALLRRGQATEAERILTALQHDDPDRILYRIGLARARLEAGRKAAALTLLEQSLHLYPGNPLLVRAYAEALLEAGRPKQARKRLQPLIRPGTDDPGLYALYARVAEAAGHRAEAHRAQAEVYFLNGQVDAAIQQLEQALRLARSDYYEASRIRARLGEIKDYARAMHASHP